MRKLFTILCLLVGGFARGQYPHWYYINFDADTSYKRLIIIDTANHRHNLWQVGTPQKSIFDSAFTPPYAILTDSVSQYGTNDTSVFILKIPARDYYCQSTPTLHEFDFLYKLDIDTDAIAGVEISLDAGGHWTNVKDSLPFGFYWPADTPNLLYSTSVWKSYAIGCFYAPPIDTFLFRFSFISDSLAAPHDGWIIDNFSYGYVCAVGVPLLQNSTLITLYPNPSHGNIYIHTDKPHKNATITIHNIQGQQVYSSTAPASGYLNLQLPNGIYTLRYSDEEEYCVKQIIIQN